MKNTNLQQPYFNTFSKVEQLVLPLNLGVLIPEDDSVRLLANILDSIDIGRFIAKCRRVSRYTHNLPE